MQSVLFRRHFQIAYVVDDIEQAVAAFSKSHGIAHWDVMDTAAMAGPGAPLKSIANAWVGDAMIELIQPDEEVSSVYAGWQKQTGLPFRLHHLGFLVDSAEQLAAHRRQLAEQGYPIAMEGSFGDMLDFVYADTTADFGHYYELIWLRQEGEAFFGRIPVN
jgi:hypothetical protein